MVILLLGHALQVGQEQAAGHLVGLLEVYSTVSDERDAGGKMSPRAELRSA